MKINKEPAPSNEDFSFFMNKMDFIFPDDLLEFLKASNGGEIYGKENYVLLWPLSELFDLNIGYEVETFAPNFFIFGSNGGETAYAIEKSSGHIYSFPFIGMSNKEAVFFCKNFNDFLNKLT